MIAARRGHTDIARLLLEHGANINAADDGGSTALMEAALKGHTETVRLLVERGADLNAVDKKCGRTAMVDAARRGHTDIVNILKAAGAKEANTPSNPCCNNC